MLGIGQRVRVFLDESSRKIFNNPVRKYHNTIATIDGVKHYRNSATFVTYTLKGVKSAYGLPYEFLPEQLIPYDVEDEEL